MLTKYSYLCPVAYEQQASDEITQTTLSLKSKTA